MVAVGVVYLLFEDFVLSDFTSSAKSTPSRNHTTRGLIGVQIGLILLAMVITRSSVSSIQARAGLPLGNQILGWTVLGKSSLHNYPFQRDS